MLLSMKIASRNVNGIRSVISKGFYDRVKNTDPDIICLQEVKAFAHQILPELKFHLVDYDFIWHQGTRAGYSGTAIFYRKNREITIDESPNLPNKEITQGPSLRDATPDTSSSTSQLEKKLSVDGRFTQLNFTFNEKKIALLNLYFPNGGTRADGTEMLSYKLQFYADFRAYIQELEKADYLVISTGDFNICHRPIDIARPEANKDSIGFLPIERAEMDKLERENFVDVFRYFHPTLADQYTWWSYRGDVRERNVGRRLDYFRVSQKILPLIKSMQHQIHISGSDHCPIILEL